jgi:RNA ligase
MYGDKMYVSDILDTDLLESHVRNGYVTARNHPHLPLTVFNYTPKAVYERLWDEVTIRCRGLIADISGLVVGNCMNKFFNYGESHAQDMDLSGPVQVTDKLDGSMGSVVNYQGELVVATRGSFESDQAKWAHQFIMDSSELLNAFKVLCSENVTAVVEIIYPENRIVVDYDGLSAVVLIGAIGNYELTAGKQLWIPADRIYSWPGPVVERFNADSFEDALRIPPRLNREGIVVYFENSGQRLKIKQADYIEAHRFISNLTPKSIWEQLRSGKTVEDLLEIAPDEFHDSVREITCRIIENKDALLEKIEKEFALITSRKVFESRREFAETIQDHPLKNYLFLRLDGRHNSLIDSVWKAIEP